MFSSYITLDETKGSIGLIGDVIDVKIPAKIILNCNA